MDMANLINNNEQWIYEQSIAVSTEQWTYLKKQSEGAKKEH